jgi:hypothetical protein
MNTKYYTPILTAAILVISALTLSITSAPKSTEAKQAEEEDPQYCFLEVRDPALGNVLYCAYGPTAKEICQSERAFLLNENPELEPNLNKCKQLSYYLK